MVQHVWNARTEAHAQNKFTRCFLRGPKKSRRARAQGYRAAIKESRESNIGCHRGAERASRQNSETVTECRLVFLARGGRFS